MIVICESFSLILFIFIGRYLLDLRSFLDAFEELAERNVKNAQEKYLFLVCSKHKYVVGNNR